ncbi:MAG: YfcC family protein [Clostridia bacterium]|nr:YfcC family protein [Clostridia bacterium]
MSEKKGLNISVKSFITALVVIFALMIAAYVLTLVIPGGEYARIPNADGNMIINTENGFSYVDGGIHFWKWLLSPILVLGASGNGTLIAVIIFLLVIGGVFNSLDRCGLMKYLLDKIANRFGKHRYSLMAVTTLFFMGMGALIGSFEECVPLVPIVVALSINLGWDALTGVGISLLAVGCGFASGVFNPFTVGVAQQLAGLPMFSGSSMRILAFVLIYFLLLFFIRLYAKKIEKPLNECISENTFVRNEKMDKGIIFFAVPLTIGIVTIFCSGFITALQDFTMIIVAVAFLVAGISACLATGMGGKALGKTFIQGIVSIFPAVLMILMASSIKYTLEEAHVLDTVLHGAVELAQILPKWAVVLFIYLIVLVMNFFISSGSAKAFMLIPLIVPIAQVFGISSQLCILAFAFGDGFSNVLYPTNAALLIGLGLADVGYVDWVKWTWKFQTATLILTSLLLLLGLAIGY